MTDITLADVDAGVRAALAAYCHALDDGRTDDVVATFAADGSVDIEGMGTHTGHDELRTAYEGWVPRWPQRHLVLNTHITDWTADEARATSDVVVLIRGREEWKVQIVGRYSDVVHRDGDRWLFHHRSATFVNA